MAKPKLEIKLPKGADKVMESGNGQVYCQGGSWGWRLQYRTRIDSSGTVTVRASWKREHNG